MKKLTFFSCAFFSLSVLHAQSNTFPSSGNVGIGTLTPAYNLDANGTFRFSGNGLLDPNYYMTINCKSGNSAAFRLGSNSTADGLMSVYKISNNQKLLQYGSLQFNVAGGYDIVGFQNSAALGGSMFTGNTETFHFYSSSGNAFFGGNVGIGTASPVAPLEVFGKIRSSPLGAVSGQFEATSSSEGNIYFQTNTTGGNGILNLNNVSGTTNVLLNTNGHSYFNGGNVGIGTISPATFLHLKNNSTTLSNKNFITIENRGNEASYNTTHVVGGLLFAGYRDVRNPANIAGVWTIRNPDAGGLASAGDLVFGASNNYGTNITTDNTLPTERMRILSNGNVLIGKSSQTNSGYILDVNGIIRSNKVVVNTTGADYVFDSAYELLPLTRLEDFLQDNQHLPGIKSAKEMQRDGVEVGYLQTKLLEKIEELTLYIIEQNKKIETLSKEMKLLKK